MNPFFFMKHFLGKSTKYYSNAQAIRFDGQNVTLDRKVRLTASCTTHVWFFPFDSMRCKIIYSSYNFGDTEMILKWKDPGLDFPVAYQSTRELGFDMGGVDKTQYNAIYGTINYCILEGSLYLKRMWSMYIIQSYLPATFLVIVSCAVFWINQKVSGLPARASIGITTLLAMLTLCRRRSSPKDNISRKFSLLDTYLWISFVFVTLTVFLFTFGDIFRQSEDYDRRRVSNKEVDRWMRAIFPISFVVFALTYWAYVYYFVISAP